LSLSYAAVVVVNAVGIVHFGCGINGILKTVGHKPKKNVV
jgi:hypothetical protein